MYARNAAVQKILAMNAARVKAIADFVRCGYSEFGVEIAAEGAESLTLTLPAAFPLTPLAADLWNEFQAPVDFRNGPNNDPVLTVWLHKHTPTPSHQQEWAPASQQPDHCGTFMALTVGVILSATVNWAVSNFHHIQNISLFDYSYNKET